MGKGWIAGNGDIHGVSAKSATVSQCRQVEAAECNGRLKLTFKVEGRGVRRWA